MCHGDDVVLIHDIVRVLAEETVVKDVANAARLHGVSLFDIALFLWTADQYVQELWCQWFNTHKLTVNIKYRKQNLKNFSLINDHVTLTKSTLSAVKSSNTCVLMYRIIF